MANAVGGKCSCCGKNLKNSILKYTSKGKLFCFDCYQLEASRIMNEQAKQNRIYEYIKKLFVIYSIPESLVSGIENLIKDGITEDEIMYILYYVYEIRENELDMNFIIPNIKRFQQEALAYKTKQEQVTEINKTKNITSESVIVKIKKADLDENSKPKFTYNMEDL